MYIAGQYGGFPAQEELWGYIDDGLIGIHLTGIDKATRMRDLMQKYLDTPMDLADPSLVAAGEAIKTRTVFTRDSDYYVYRYNDREPFEVLP